jgi:hypothetical protein
VRVLDAIQRACDNSISRQEYLGHASKMCTPEAIVKEPFLDGGQVDVGEVGNRSGDGSGLLQVFSGRQGRVTENKNAQ